MWPSLNFYLQILHENIIFHLKLSFPGEVVCSSKSLDRVVKDLGKKIKSIKNKNMTYEDCKKMCFENNDCQSFGYCTSAQNCHLFDKKLDGSEPLKPPNGCFTSYKICKDGKYFRLHH